MRNAGMQPKSGGKENLFRATREVPESHSWKFAIGMVVILLAGLALAVLGSGGCSPKTTISTNAGRPFEEVVVRVACPDELTEKVIKRYGMRWASEENAHVETVRYDLAAGPEKTSRADLW